VQMHSQHLYAVGFREGRAPQRIRLQQQVLQRGKQHGMNQRMRSVQ